MRPLPKLLLFQVLTCLGQNVLGDEIINGQIAAENSMQYMVSLQNSRGHHGCGGFLVNEDFVLTAAHCDEPTPVSTVVFGTHNLKRVTNKNRRKIVKRYTHPQYQNVEHGKDIMLLKLSQKVQLGNSVQTIPLPKTEMNIPENENCRVAGWGLTRTGGTAVDELRVVDVSIIQQQVCARVWGGLPDNVICAGGYKTNKGFCQGDSGGPLVWKGVAVGVVSFNNQSNCDYPDVPNVYTDISKYLPWIKSILKRH
uniref:granzyme B-like n=1 Tax=Scatophagus argus TaxID=75038 RepID=UPI001ED83B5E|nr:granzyme B-like [Scatophagus argus]